MTQPNPILSLLLEEATELIQHISLDLLAIERAPDTLSEGRARILRSAHTLKGSAAAAGVDDAERQLHVFESCVQRLGKSVPALEVTFELLHRALDTIEANVVLACTGQAPQGSWVVPTVSELSAVFGADLDCSAFGALEGNGGAGPGVHPNASALGAADATIRVATEKLDRQMAAVEELVRVKVGAQQRAEEAQRVYEALEELNSLVVKLRPATNGHDRRAQALERTLAVAIESVRRQSEQALRRVEQLSRGVRSDADLLDTLAGRLQDDIRALRMVPVASVFGSFERTVRDVARKQKKAVGLRLEGGETEIDRDLLERLRGPIVHLLRNAVDHGIEPPEERTRVGKGETSEIVVTAESRRGGLCLTIRDDGRGIDPKAIRAAAVRDGVVSANEAAELSDQAAQLLVLRAGLSTATSVSEISGRGVGLDAVRVAVEQSGGSIEVRSEPGRGSEFALHLPLSLTTQRMLMVRVQNELFALPTGAIERVIRVEPEDVHLLDTGPAIEHDNKPVPTARLAEVLGLSSGTANQRQPGLVIASLGVQAVVLVDAIDEEQEMVVKSLGDQLEQVAHIAGATVLPSGRIVPVLSVPEIVRSARGANAKSPLFIAPDAPRARPKRILIVDDSITTRTLEKSILEAVGYSVETATDGLDALARLERGEFDLVLSDVQMPRMDGIELAKRVRSNERHRSTPLVLVSSLVSDEDKRRGLQAGADAYLGKSEFRQELLLETLERLL